jgi:hypothetical protein
MTPTDGSPITAYSFRIGGVIATTRRGYSRLDYWTPPDSRRLWRYNYLYWVC